MCDVSKFQDNRPRQLGDMALQIARKKRMKAKKTETSAGKHKTATAS